MHAFSLEWATFWVSVIGSIATVAALATAIGLGVHEARAIRRETAQRDQEQREDRARRRRAQAESVSARLHVEPQAIPPSMGAVLWGAVEHHSWAEVFNASALPIYEVEVLAPHPEAPPGAHASCKLAFVPGGETGHVHTPRLPDHKLNGQPLSLYFRDAANVAWHRLVDGELHEVSGPGCSDGT